MSEEGSLVPANQLSQEGRHYGQRPLVPDLDDPIGDILEEIARLKGENKWLTEMMQSNLGHIVLPNKKIDSQFQKLTNAFLIVTQ